MDKTTPENRYRFIELMAWWEGRINARLLIQQFGLSRQQASIDISTYRERAPDNLSYDGSQKAFLPTETFAANT